MTLSNILSQPHILVLAFVCSLAAVAGSGTYVWTTADRLDEIARRQTHFELSVMTIIELTDQVHIAAHNAAASGEPGRQLQYAATVGQLNAQIRTVEKLRLDTASSISLTPASLASNELRAVERRAIQLAMSGKTSPALALLGSAGPRKLDLGLRMAIRSLYKQGRAEFEAGRTASRNMLKGVAGGTVAAAALLIGFLITFIQVMRQQAATLATSAAQLSQANASLETRVLERTALLDAERQKFKNFAETTSDWFWETGPDFKIKSVSDNFAEAVGIEDDEFVGKNLFDLNPSEFHGSQFDQWTAHIATKSEIRNMYIRIQSQTRGKIYMRLAGRAAAGANGGFAGYRGTAVDITQGLAQSRATAQGQKLQALGTMAAGLAHEFNNILAIVMGYAESLRERLRHDEDACIQIDHIADAGRRGVNLSRSLLSFGRSSQGGAREVFSVRAIGVELPGLLKPLLGPAHTIVFEVDPQALWVNGDRDLLLQCLVNLVVNARDAMPGGGKVTLSLQPEPADSEHVKRAGLPAGRQYVSITAADTGSGMDRKTLAKVFDPFFTTKEVGKGTGLGLSLLFSFVQDLHGHVNVESELGQGTTFRILLPMSPPPAVAKIATASAARPDFTGRRVLLVDDEPQLVAIAGVMLKNLGFDVISRTDVNEALAVVDDEREHIDLIVSDVLMPHMSGFKFAELAQSLRKVDVLFITGQPERGDGDGASVPKGAKILRKPFDKNQLSLAIGDLLRAQVAA